jgi:hypothetical protein
MNGKSSKLRPLPTDFELEIKLAGIDPRHWPMVRARVAALREAAAGTSRAPIARAAALLGLTRERIHQLLRIWHETGSVAQLVPGAARRDGVARLDAKVIGILESAVHDVLTLEPAAGVESIAKEVRRRCADVGLKPPASMTIRRRVVAMVADAGGWDALSGAVDTPPTAGLVLDRSTLGMPVRAEDGSDPGLPRAVMVVDLATGRILTARLEAGGSWAAEAAGALVEALGRTEPAITPLPLIVEVERDVHPDWRTMDAAFARAGARLLAKWSPRPGTGRRLARLLGAKVGGIPLLTRGMDGDAPERLRRWRKSRPAPSTPIDPERARRMLDLAVAMHNAGRQGPRGTDPWADAPRDALRRARLVSALTSLTMSGISSVQDMPACSEAD